jgi:hypothetical protein
MKKSEQPVLFDIPAVPRKQRDKWEELEEFAREGFDQQGLVVPIDAAQLLELSKQRIYHLMEAKRLQVWEFFGRKYLSVRELRAFIDIDRPCGRPVGWRKHPEMVSSK